MDVDDAPKELASRPSAFVSLVLPDDRPDEILDCRRGFGRRLRVGRPRGNHL
jgi:hypothetical protein